ncbi:MAG TPA: hypothetical protein VFW66_00735, partial [Gemmatimonadales bacterium]|nr:hypothetical protein [Gemmatimonadales bacterium]
MPAPLRAILPQPAGQTLPGAALSVVTHAALIAFAVMRVAAPAASRRTHAPLRAQRVETVRYVALAPPPTPVPVAPRATAPHPRSRPTPPPDAIPTELRQPRVTVEESDSADDPPAEDQLAGLTQAVQRAPLQATPPAAPQAENAGGAAEDVPGSLRVVELRTPTSTACPVLRRRPGMGDEEVHVTVAFEVDSLGAVDSSTIRVL